MQDTIDARAAEISARLGTLHVENSGSSSAAAAAAEGGPDEQRATRTSSMGLDERRRLTVATMSPEDIILCVDVGPEMSTEWSGVGQGGGVTSRMHVVKSALCGFVRRKSSFNHLHRFALCTLGDGVRVVTSLTSDVRFITESIDHLQPEKKSENPLQEEIPFDFSELLATIAEKFPPKTSSSRSSSVPPERVASGNDGRRNLLAGITSEVRSVVRAVVIFGRSYTRPRVPEPGRVKLLSNPRFFLDCVYVHRKPSNERVVCQEAFDLIVSMEGPPNHFYFLECSHNLQRFNVNMGALLAHPVQRDYQEVFFDKLDTGAAGGTDVPIGAPLRSPTQVRQTPIVGVPVASSFVGGGSTNAAPGAGPGMDTAP